MKEAFEFMQIAELLHELKKEDLRKKYPNLYKLGLQQLVVRLDKLENVLEGLKNENN